VRYLYGAHHTPLWPNIRNPTVRYLQASLSRLLG